MGHLRDAILIELCRSCRTGRGKYEKKYGRGEYDFPIVVDEMLSWRCRGLVFSVKLLIGVKFCWVNTRKTGGLESFIAGRR
jgi:hypothetical protein